MSWRISARGKSGAPVNAEATFRMYDRSLEYYSKNIAKPWVEELYPHRDEQPNGEHSVYPLGVQQLPIDHDWLKQMLGLFEEAAEQKHRRTFAFRRHACAAASAGSGPFPRSI